ncbi:oxoglutarate-dependent flavonoid 7-O-demethylase 1 [Coffea arabica]|uniref:Oxoglutarate-dependent flavonoid 7-O-demethylase 1 n=2 Tax=Coffea TaxID=13442 RepID=A0A6P6UFY3_COFAR
MKTSITLKELDNEPLLVVPQRYKRDDQEPSFFSDGNPMPVIPTVDMESLTLKETKAFDLQKLHSTCKTWGIFQLVNHGVSSSVMEKLKYEIEEFYKLPLEEKMRYELRPGDFEGYGQTILHSDDQKVDWADRFYMVFNPIHRRKPHLLPKLPSLLRESMETYFKEIQKLAMVLFNLMGEALGVDNKEMEDMFEDGMQSVRMTYYPPCPQPELVMGISPHSDATGITILSQVNGVEGFQVKKDGVWIPVNILPNAFVVIVGDILEILSNGTYKSVEHRATVNSSKERISIAIFFNPKFEAEIGPFTCTTTQESPPLFRRLRMEQYVKTFFSRKLDGKSFLKEMKIERDTLTD